MPLKPRKPRVLEFRKENKERDIIIEEFQKSPHTPILTE